MNQAELLRYLVETFEALGIDYMISGSQASIYYGEPRFTQDIDVVAEVTPAHVPGLLERFPFPEFYLSEDAVREAIQVRGQFNIIHPGSGLKIGPWVLRSRSPSSCARTKSSNNGAADSGFPRAMGLSSCCTLT